MERFNLLLRGFIEATGKSVSQVGREVGLRPTTMARLLNDRATPTRARMEAFVPVFGAHIQPSIEAQLAHDFSATARSKTKHLGARALLRRLHEAGIRLAAVDRHAGYAKGYGSSMCALSHAFSDRWIEAAEYALAGGTLKAVPRAPSAPPKWRTKMDAEDARLVAALEEAGVSLGDIDVAAGYVRSYAVGCWDMDTAPSARWRVAAERALGGAIGGYVGGMVTGWTPTQQRVYSAIWEAEDATVATAYDKLPGVDVRGELLKMGIPEEQWP